MATAIQDSLWLEDSMMFLWLNGKLTVLLIRPVLGSSTCKELVFSLRLVSKLKNYDKITLLYLTLNLAQKIAHINYCIEWGCHHCSVDSSAPTILLPRV